MAARHEEEDPQRLECENCGGTSDLLRCSRCHAVWFCSGACQKAYWPFHKQACRPNQFADAMEPADPKFARWMRAHGKLAVIKDPQVERLERASQPGGWSGQSRQDVMDSMYGLINPAPKGPQYSQQEQQAMQQAADARAAAEAQGAAQGGRHKAWDALEVPQGLGTCCSLFKWFQSQSHVHVFVLLPPTIAARQVQVQLSPSQVLVQLVDDVVLSGPLYKAIKAEDSTWFVEGGVLHLQLLKRNRKGHYANGATNADTFWRALLRRAAYAEDEALPEQPPLHYYWSPCEGED